MSNYSGAGGINQQKMNELSKKIYDSVYPAYFKGEKKIDFMDIKTIYWDITQAPVFDLNPSEKAKTILKNMVNEASEDTHNIEDLKQYIDDSIITFELSVPVFNITVEPKMGKKLLKIDGSITVYLKVDITLDNTLVIEIIKSEIKIQAQETLMWILNNIVLPIVENEINKILLKGMPLPELKIENIALSTPVAMMDNQTLVLFISTSASGATVPPKAGTDWPKNKFIVASDPAFMATIGTEELKKHELSGDYSFQGSGFKGDINYSLLASIPGIQLIGGSKLITGLDILGQGKVSISEVDVKGHFSLDIQASAEVTGEIQVTPSNDILVKIISINHLKINFIFPKKLKPWLKALEKVIVSILEPYFKKIINQLKGLILEVYTIPEIDIDKGGINLVIRVVNVGINSITDSENKIILVVTGDVEVDKQAW